MTFGLSQEKKREDWWKSGYFYEFGNPPNLSNIESFIANSFYTKEAVKKLSISKKILNHYEIDRTKFYKETEPSENDDEPIKEVDIGKMGEELYNICVEYAIPARDLVLDNIQKSMPDQQFTLLLDYFDKLSVASGVSDSIRNYEYKRFYQIFYSKDINLVFTYTYLLEEIGDSLDTTINFTADFTTLESVFSRISDSFFDFNAFKTYDNLERKKKPLGNIYALSGGSMNSPPNLSKLGKIKQKLCPENYSEEVMKEIDEAKLHLQKTNPRGRMIILNGPPGTGKCVDEDSLIMNPETGLLEKIKDVVQNKTDVLSHDLKQKILRKKPSAWLDMGYKDCRKISLKSGNFIIGTPEHPVLTVDGWKKLADLSIDDSIAIASKIPFPDKTIDISDKEIYILAGLLAEGGYTSNKVVFSNTEEEILNIFGDSLSLVTGSLSAISKSNCDYLVRSEKSTINGRLSQIRELLNKNLMGRTLAKEKIVPDVVFSFGEENLCKFLGMFWSCDGSIQKNGSITLGLASEILVDQIQHLLLRIGILSTKRNKVNSCNGKSFKSWEITVLASSKEIFKNKIPMIGKKKSLLEKLPLFHNPNEDLIPLSNSLKAKIITVSGKFMKSGGKIKQLSTILGWKKRFSVNSLIRRKNISKRTLKAFIDLTKCVELEWLLNVRWSKVVKVEDVGERHVYDLTVDDNHCFVANDIIVHNTTLVKHFIAECIGTYIYVPIEAIQTLMNPSIWEVFADYKDESHPFVLILEDADAYLSIRNKKNVSKISHLLNIGDGIIGASLDIRIVATTNCQQDDIDPAFLRPGRLNSRIEIGKLSKKECLNFLKEKGRDDLKGKLPKNKMTLAELYAFINYGNKEDSNKVHT